MKVKHGMDVSPDGQGEKNTTIFDQHPLTWQLNVSKIHFILIFDTDGPPEMEPHEDYEDENFNFTAPENMENNDAPNLTKLSEVAIQELDYYNFGKDVGNYSTA